MKNGRHIENYNHKCVYRASKYIKQKTIELKGNKTSKKYTIMVGTCNITPQNIRMNIRFKYTYKVQWEDHILDYKTSHNIFQKIGIT